MREDRVTVDRLERQKSVIDTTSSRINARAAAGEPVDLSLSLLRQEERLYRRMLGEAPLEVLEEFAAAARFT